MRLAVLIFLLWSADAKAHDVWSNGKKVDPITKQLCCSEADTKQISLKLIRVEKEGVRLLDTDELIPFDRVQPSPDDNIWVSRWGGMTKCFFYPDSF